MKRIIDIFGSYIDTEYEREDENDITPNIFKDSISDLVAGDELEIHVNSAGGSCTSGIAIANLIRGLNSKGVMTTCIVDGVCCSIATLTAMACQKLKMYPQSFLMIHNAWTVVQGDAEALRKEATSLEAMSKAIMSFYHEKFDLSDEQLSEMMQSETWISGSQKDDFKLNAILLEDKKQFKMAAKLIEAIQKFNNKDIIERFNNMKNETVEEVGQEVADVIVDAELSSNSSKPEEDTIGEVKADEEGTSKVTEEVTLKENIEEVEEVEKPSYEELERQIELLTSQLDECKAKLAECESEDVEKRVSGMQSTMQNKINLQKKEFMDKLELKDKELADIKMKLSDLSNEFETAKRELSDKTSALEENKTALAKLNANVLTPKAEPMTNWRNLNGEQFIEWVETHKDDIKNNKIN